MPSLNLNEAIEAIKKAGVRNARCVPMEGQAIDGNYQIEVRENGSWAVIVTNVKQRMAEDIISQASNRVILG